MRRPWWKVQSPSAGAAIDPCDNTIYRLAPRSAAHKALLNVELVWLARRGESVSPDQPESAIMFFSEKDGKCVSSAPDIEHDDESDDRENCEDQTGNLPKAAANPL